MQQFSELTRNTVLVSLATHMQDKLGRTPLTELHVRVAASAGILPYLKLRQRRDLFAAYADNMDRVGYGWRSHAQHGSLLQQLEELGGLNSIPGELRKRYVKWLTLCYIGEPGGYGAGINRKVFFSNSAEPLISEMFANADTWPSATLDELRKDKVVAAAMKRDDAIGRRFEALVDLVED